MKLTKMAIKRKMIENLSFCLGNDAVCSQRVVDDLGHRLVGLRFPNSLDLLFAVSDGNQCFDRKWERLYRRHSRLVHHRHLERRGWRRGRLCRKLRQ